jgi:ABC-type bacteriocin/lantibiotic exporter with double-glycine peptidase domain
MRWVLSALGLAALVGMAVQPARAQSLSHTIERVPFVKQEPKWCGPAALASVLRFYGLDITQQAIAKEIALPNGEVLNLDLKLYARRKGFRAESRRGNLDLLKLWIDRDVPVISQMRLGGIASRAYHFVVVYGFDERKLCFIVHTGERAAQQISFFDFSRSWQEAGNWMLVIRRQRPARDQRAQAKPSSPSPPKSVPPPAGGDSSVPPKGEK